MGAGLLCVMLFVGQAASDSAAELPAARTLSVWDCETTAGLEGVELEQTRAKQGRAAIRWTNHPAMPRLDIPGVPQDWTDYNLLRFWIHNARPLPARFMVIISSENPQTEGSDYWGYPIKLDFTGWREVILPIGQCGGTRSPRGWDQIDSLCFTASGWGNEPHPEADVVIDDVRLQFEPPRPGPRMTDAEFFDALDLQRPELKAVRQAVQTGDIAGAKSALLDHFRSRQRPRWWFDWRDRPPRNVPVTGGSDGWDYFVTDLKVDWTGWRLITLPLKQWRSARSPIGWHWINSLSFSATYGDRTPDPKTGLVLDEVQLTGRTPAKLGQFEQDSDFQRWTNLLPTKTWVKSGRRAALWADLRTRNGIGISNVPRDWRSFEALQFWAYSATATGDVITIAADSDTPASVSRAESVLAHIHDSFYLGDDIDWQANKYDPDEPAFTREWTYGLNRFGDWRILGRAYWDTSDERFAREWIAQMRDWVEDNPWPIVGTGNSTLTWRTIEAGIRTSGAWPDALYYFLGSPSLKPDDLVVFLKSWIEHAHHLMRITTDYPEHQGNWVTMECNGLGHLAILLPECKDSPVWLQTAADRMALELDRQVYPDGAQKELTTGYHQVARRNFVELYRFAMHNNIEMPPRYFQRLERMYDYNLRAMTPDGHLPPLNDAGYTGVRSSLAEGAELFGRDDFRWAASSGAIGEPPDYTSVAFPYAGQYVMRSGWQPDDRYLLFESGPFGIGHQHEDKLSMFVYGYGRPLLTEAGTYSYDHSKFRRYVLGTWAHNTVLVDGQQQHRSGLIETYATNQPLDNLWLHNEAFDAADGIYDSGYGPQREISVQHERTVVFVRPDYWVVLDRLHADESHRYDILWHLNNGAAGSDPQTLAGWGADPEMANLLITPATDEELELEIVTGREDPVLGFAPAKSKRPIPVLNYRCQSRGPAVLAWVLTPFREHRPSVRASLREQQDWTVIAITHERGTDYIGVAPRGRTSRLTIGDETLAGRIALVRQTESGRTVRAVGGGEP